MENDRPTQTEPGENDGNNGTGGIDGNEESTLMVAILELEAAVPEPQKNKLKGIIEQVRKSEYAKGFADGYASAMREAEDILQSDEASNKRPAAAVLGAEHLSPAERRLAGGFKARLTTGQADQKVDKALAYIGARKVSATELLHIIKELSGDAMPFTTMRRALNRMLDKGRATYDPETQLWGSESPSPDNRLRRVQ